MGTRATLLPCLSVLIVVALLGSAMVAPTAAQPANDSNSTGSANGGEQGPPPNTGSGTVVSCSEVKNNPQGSGPDYRIVEGACSVSISDGEILSNVWFRGDGEVSIDASGSGWTIRNVAVTNHTEPEDSPLDLQVDSENGVGVVANFWASDIASNVMFIHPDHRGRIIFRGFTAINVNEDVAYASRPGNPPSLTRGDPKIIGQEGTVGFRDVYIRDAGHGPLTGYGIRLGSDGSYLINATIINTGGPAVANTFGSGKNPKQRPQAFDGVLIRNVDIIQPDGIGEDPGSGIRLNNHQNHLKPEREWTSVTTLENVDIEAADPLDRNLAGGKEPIVRGSYGTNPDPTPPPNVPGSPIRAASGVGGGTGSIGGAVGGPSGIFGPTKGLIVLVMKVSGLLLFALFLVFLIAAGLSSLGVGIVITAVVVLKALLYRMIRRARR